MVRTNIKMIHPAQIAALGLSGCKTIKGVVSFCQKNKQSINCAWWYKDNQRILLVDPDSFRQRWKQVYGRTTQKNTYRRGTSSHRKTRTNRTTNRRWTTSQRKIYRRAA